MVIISVLKLMDELINAGHAGLGILMSFVTWSLITFSKYARPVSELYFLSLGSTQITPAGTLPGRKCTVLILSISSACK